MPHQALEEMAFQEPDRRPRNAAAWALAAAAGAARSSARAPPAAAAAVTPAGYAAAARIAAACVKAASALPEEGAMRPLLEHVATFLDRPGVIAWHVP